MNYCFKIVFSLLLCTAINSCIYSQNTKVVSNGCVILNNKGTEYLSNYPMNGEAGLDTAINLFIQAIQCDSTYLAAYINISNAYDKKHNYHEEMKVYNKLLALTNNHSPSMITHKGVLFERVNDIDSAKKYYYIANKEYERELKKDPENVENVKGLILIKALTNGKDDAIREIDRQIKLHPDFQLKLSGEYEYYKVFNRHNYIYNLPTEIDDDGH